MTKLVAIRLLQTCMIGSLPRSPVEGVQFVPKDEADRHIGAGMAELADVDGDDAGSEADGLDKLKLPELKKLADAEKVVLRANATRADFIAAIRDSRDRVEAKETLSVFDRAKLLEIVKDDEVEVADGASDDEIREAILTKTFPCAAA